MVKIDGSGTNIITENKGKIAAGGVGLAIGVGTVLYNVINSPSESTSGKAQVNFDANYKFYVDHSEGNGTLYLAGGLNGSERYEMPHTEQFQDDVVSVLSNASRALVENGNYSIESFNIQEGRDALVRLVPSNSSDNDSIPVSETISAVDFDKVMTKNLVDTYIKPDLDKQFGVDGWEYVDKASNPGNVTDGVNVNFFSRVWTDPMHNEEVEDVISGSHSDRMLDILNVSMATYHPMNGSEDNESKAEIESARADYLALMDDVNNGKAAKMRVTYRLNDNGDEEAFGAIQYGDHNLSKAVKLPARETLDITADGILGDGDGVEELDNFMSVKLIQQAPEFDSESIINVETLQEARDMTPEKWTNMTKSLGNANGRYAGTFDREWGLGQLETAGAKYNMNMSQFRTGMDETDSETFEIYDTSNGGVVRYMGKVQVGLDETTQEPIFEETIRGQETITPEMADMIERAFGERGY